MDHKYRYRVEDDKHVVTIENAKGERVDEKILGSHRAAMQLRDAAQAEGVKSFADIGGKTAEKAEKPAVSDEPKQRQTGGRPRKPSFGG